MEEEKIFTGYGVEPDDYHEDTMSCTPGQHNCNKCPCDRESCQYWNNIKIKGDTFDIDRYYRFYLEPGKELYYAKK